MKHTEIMGLIQDELITQTKREGRHAVRRMANYSGLSSSTIYNLRRGKTVWARGTTIDCMMDTLHLELVVQRRK